MGIERNVKHTNKPDIIFVVLVALVCLSTIISISGGFMRIRDMDMGRVVMIHGLNSLSVSSIILLIYDTISDTR